MYNHNKIEKKWQQYWEDNHTYKFIDLPNEKKFYALDMFPYPSGKGLHVGHPKGYTATDIMARFKKLLGYNVLHPIGWDAFGLPAEQYAIDTNNSPKEFTLKNINNFRQQLKKLGFSYDYNKEVNTTDPKYFKWTQWIFLQMFKNGLAEIKDIEVNWCEKLGTVLSNEEIVIDKNGMQVSERGNYPVIKKPMRQWILKITKYANKLLDGLNELDWPESLKNLQRNWIGKTEGFLIDLNYEHHSFQAFIDNIKNLINVQYVLVSTKANLINQLNLSIDELEQINQWKNKSNKFLKQTKEYSYLIINKNIINPLTNKPILIIVTDFVDNNFNLDCILNYSDDLINDFLTSINKTYVNNDNININDNDLNNIKYKKITTYKLKDWLFSRQRYWGEPFPIIYDENNNPIAIDENELPLLLPTTDNYKPNNDGSSVLSKISSWINIEINNKHYHRDANTMPQWAGSCWYYLGYILKLDDDSYIPLNSEIAYDKFKRWLPVDLYIGGQEHAVLHLLYARFWHHFLYDINIVPTKEPFYKIINQGMILGPDGEKMSKSKGNIINPDDIIENYGADALRLYEMFMGPLTSSMPWDNEKIIGVRKWLDRVYRLYFETNSLNINIENDVNKLNKELVYDYHVFIKNVTNSLENQQFNIAISDMMIFINSVYKYKQFNALYMKNFSIILSVFCPHLGEEIFHLFANDSVYLSNWPTYDSKIIEKDTVVLPIIINNKPRCTIEVDKNINQDDLYQLVYAHDKVKSLYAENKIEKIIYVKNKIINILLKKE